MITISAQTCVFIAFLNFLKNFLNFYNNSNLKAKNTNKHINACWYLVIFLFYIHVY